MKKYISLLLALVLVAGSFFISKPMPVSAGTVTDIQDGVTLHCWNWSYQNIESKMASIASAGYTAIQVSPIQQAKQTTAGAQTYDWWVFYQPASFSIDNTGRSALGTKAQFESMCRTAHSYGIKVIVDVVANHMGDNGGNNKSPSIIDDLEKDASCWHDISKNTYDYSKRYDVTQWCMDGLPDLNTGSDKVQSYVLNFLKECIDAGADGFRFDAAKHIETPEDGGDNCASDFWPTVINGAKSYAQSTRGIQLYCYGELLDSPGGSLPVSAYTKYMSITDNTWSNYVRDGVVGSGNAGAYSYSFHKDASSDQLVLWAESHDTYVAGSSGMSAQNINKVWALVAARADAMALYLARPSSYTQKLGTASADTGWANKETAAVNKFHTAFVGQSEYVANEGRIAYVERGDSGVVLVDCGGNGGSVNVTNHVLRDGTYTDQISGNSFTVSNGQIRGTIGSTGIAVVYNGAVSQPTPMQTIYFTAPSGWSFANVYSWYTDNGEITSSWPGDAMTRVEGNLYSCQLPGDAVNVIFNNGVVQTDDLTIPAGMNLYDFSSGTWSSYATACTHPSLNPDGSCAVCGMGGSFYVASNINGWQPADETNKMNYTGGKYVFSMDVPAGTTEFKVTNGTWDSAWPSENYVFNAAFACTVTITFDSASKKITVTGYEDAGVGYYLYGYIDGVDYEGRDYPFVNGSVVVNFAKTSYVYIGTDDGTRYMAQSYITETSGNLYAASESVWEKMRIPAGELTLTLTQNGDGSLTLSYREGVVCKEHSYISSVTKPTLTANGYTTFTCEQCGDSYVEDYTFPDVPSTLWSYDSIEFAVAKGFFSGYKSGNFGPTDNISRQDFVVVLARIAGVDLSQYSGRTVFSDVKAGDYYEKAVKWASSEGIVNGYKNGKFGVGDSITREQMVTILHNYAKKCGYDVSVPESAAAKLSAYTDAHTITGYAKPAVIWALHKGVISGMSSTTIAPQDNASRGQAAAILMNISKKNIMPI